MTSTVFYSWQSDLPNGINRSFIEEALERAAKAIRSDGSLSIEPVIQRDTRGAPGAPDIAGTILARIEQAQAFVCDVSIINPRTKKRQTPNPNVLIELGYAIKSLGWERLVLVVNTAYGGPELLPFDLRPKRVMTYTLVAGSTDKSAVRSALQSRLEEALRAILQQPDTARDLAAETEELVGLAPETLAARTAKLLDAGRMILLRKCIQRYPQKLVETAIQSSKAGRDDVTEPSRASFLRMLDGLTSMGVALLKLEEWGLFDEVQRALHQLCVSAAKAEALAQRTTLWSLDRVWIWTEVLVRAYVLGAFLVHRGAWAQAHKLIQQEATWDPDYRASYWSRCVMIRASRVGLVEKGWARCVGDYVRGAGWLAGFPELDGEAALDLLCQFDFLQCIDVALNHPRGLAEAYPSFGGYYRQRVESMIATLIHPGALRSSLRPLTDTQLAKLLRDLDDLVGKALPFGHRWFGDGWQDAGIRAFLQANPFER